MKKNIAKYLLFIYTKFIIIEDLDIYKKWALPFIKATHFVEKIYIWLFSIIFFPIFVILMFSENKLNKLIIKGKIKR